MTRTIGRYFPESAAFTRRDNRTTVVLYVNDFRQIRRSAENMGGYYIFYKFEKKSTFGQRVRVTSKIEIFRT